MAAAETELKFTPFSVYGNLAYGLSRTAEAPEYWPEPENEPAPEAVPEQHTAEIPGIAERPGERVHVRTRTKAALRVSPLAVTGLALVGILLVLVLLSYVNLTKISDSSVALKNEISALEKENIKLRVQYESVFDLNAIEEYATSNLGMIKADKSQIGYLDSGASDKAVILRRDEKSLSESVKGFFGSIAESLR